MLHFETVEPSTLSLLNKIITIPELKNFSLVGGTALALKFGHRKSVDLDLFSQEKFEINDITSLLEKNFGSAFRFERTNVSFALFCEIDHVKTDLVHYPHPIISPVEMEEGIRMYGNMDIAAMKINAILGRGAKKDFWDLAELLTVYSLEEIIAFHKQKFPTQMLAISIPAALTYFEDAEESEDPVSLKGQNWTGVKKYIQHKVSEYLS
ncbi:MAG: nucleotidyl transferase AbiEii/AbiGii toxin family protein [Bacteroidia bacterium]